MQINNDQGSIRIGGAIYVPQILSELGTDPVAVFHEANIDLALFDDPDNLITFAARIDLFNLCALKTGCKYFGLLVGQRCDMSIFGLVGFMVMNSPDVQTALQGLVRYFHLHVRGAAPSVTVQGNLAMLGYTVYQKSSWKTDQLTDAAVATAFNIMRGLCGSQWRPVEVMLAHRKPEDVKPFVDFFKAPLRFDADHNGVVFSAEWMSRSLPAANAQLRRILQKQVEIIEAKHNMNFVDEVRCVLKSALPSGNATADKVAALFSMHDRTLSRRLLAHGISFQKLLDESRFDISRQMLVSSEMGLGDIAAALNYSDVSSFTRAFHRWSGTTPARWRDKAKAHSN